MSLYASAHVSLQTEGFAVFRSMLEPAYCTRLGRAVVMEHERLLRLGWRFTKGGRFTGHLNFHPGQYGPQVLEQLRGRGIVDLAEQAIGRRLEVAQYFGNFNRVGSTAQDMHQDWKPPHEAVIINLLLTTTNANNGAAEFVPASHSSQFSYRTLYRSGQIRKARRMCGEPGDVYIRFGTLWHRGMPNRGTAARPMMTIIMTPCDSPAADPDTDEPMGFYANRYYGKLALVRELSEVYLAPLFHCLRYLLK